MKASVQRFKSANRTNINTTFVATFSSVTWPEMLRQKRKNVSDVRTFKRVELNSSVYTTSVEFQFRQTETASKR